MIIAPASYTKTKQTQKFVLAMSEVYFYNRIYEKKGSIKK